MPSNNNSMCGDERLGGLVHVTEELYPQQIILEVEKIEVVESGMRMIVQLILPAQRRKVCLFIVVHTVCILIIVYIFDSYN